MYYPERMCEVEQGFGSTTAWFMVFVEVIIMINAMYRFVRFIHVFYFAYVSSLLQAIAVSMITSYFFFSLLKTVI